MIFNPIEFFKCPRYITTLTRGRCADMHKTAHKSNRRDGASKATSDAVRCRGCEIGAAHRRGEVLADVPTVVLVAKPSGLPMGRSKMAWQDPMPFVSARRRKGKGGW